VQGRLACGLAFREWGDPARPGALLWPGLGAPGTYFAGVANGLGVRAVAVDPPGTYGSPALSRCTHQALVELAKNAMAERHCSAMLGHSLGAYVALGVGADPPAVLKTIVLVDGGFMDAAGLVGLGLPVLSGRTELAEFLRSNSLRFPDWQTATQEVARLLCAEVSPALESYLREVMVEADGEVIEASSPERESDLLLAATSADVVALAGSLAVPALLVACGQPSGHRPLREKAWDAFVAASPMVELCIGDDCAHNPVLQAPGAISAVISDWLRAHL
jgi:pimeloyl-ACP methyl ester carboxylesterase